MKPALLGLVLAAIALDAQAIGRLADVEIIDRDSGSILATHYYKGEYWVAGTPGARYAISIRNARGERLLAVTAVDGINVISGDAAAWGQTGYVFGPRQGYEIAGWRKSNQEVAAFEFTASPHSYAERTGRPANVGVIGVALFLERAPQPVYRSYAAPERREEPVAGAANEARGDAAPVPSAPAPASKASASLGALRDRLGAAASAKLGTGHGEREQSYVENTEFERLSATPNEVIRIRYDSFDNLVAMGIIRQRLPARPRPNAFPDSPPERYTPDPPAYGALGLR